MPKEEHSGFQLDQSGWLVATTIPGHFVEAVPTSWPWDITVIEVPVLLQKINLPQVHQEEVRQLLMDLSNVILRDGLRGDVDLCCIKLGGRGGNSRREWVQRIAGLPSSERLRCCVHNKANVRILDGRALLLNPDNESELLFGEDPVAWIRNGLWALDSAALASLRSEQGKEGSIFPCPAFIIQTRDTPSRDEAATPIIPGLYVGHGSSNTEIAARRAGSWCRDVADGYALKGKELQACWVRQIPNAAEPDPVYRFIREPSEHLLAEALLFLRQVHNAPTKPLDATGDRPLGPTPEHNPRDKAPGPLASRTAQPEGEGKKKWYHDQHDAPPAEFNVGPLAGQKKELTKVCLGTDVDHRTFEKACREGHFWARELSRVESEFAYGVWFKDERLFQDAEQRLKILRKRNAGSNAGEHGTDSDSPRPASE